MPATLTDSAGEYNAKVIALFQKNIKRTFFSGIINPQETIADDKL